jgi:pyrimidine-nucleoside phosphorylase
VNRLGLCLIGQTAEIAPADRKLYALRDATATVESIPLIASSILSKKLAEGIDALVLDVKVGRGAFMKELPRAQALARTMVDLCKAVGRGCTALITDMDAPLGYAVGNAVEVAESIDVLRGGGPADVRELTLLLGVEMLIAGEPPGLAGAADPVAEARRLLESALDNGSALQRFIALVEAQGGDPRCIEDPSRLPRPKAVRELRADRSGYLVALDAEAVGLAAVELGAGRARKEDKVDPAAGLLLRKRVGDDVREGEVLAELHARDGERLEAGAKRLRTAVLIDASPPASRALLIDRIA